MTSPVTKSSFPRTLHSSNDSISITVAATVQQQQAATAASPAVATGTATTTTPSPNVGPRLKVALRKFSGEEANWDEWHKVTRHRPEY